MEAEIRAQQRKLISAIGNIKEIKAEAVQRQILADKKVSLILDVRPELRVVIRDRIEKGELGKEDHEKATRILEKARISAELSILLDSRPELKRGGPTRSVRNLKVALKEGLDRYASINDQANCLASDTTYNQFLMKMCLVLDKIGITKDKVTDNPLLMGALLDHTFSEFILMGEAGLKDSIISTNGHNFTFFHANEVYAEARRVFGSEEDSEPLVRTAAIMLFTKSYKSIHDAKSAYDNHISEARRVFGSDKDSEPLVRTAASRLFTKSYKSIHAAKSAYDKCLAEARRVFGSDESSEPLVRTAAHNLFIKKYESIDDAKSAYDKYYQAARKIQKKYDENGARTLAMMAFEGISYYIELLRI